MRACSLGQEDLHWRRKWQPTPVFLPGESHGQRSLAAYSPWGLKRVRHDWVHIHTQVSPDLPKTLVAVCKGLGFCFYFCFALFLVGKPRLGMSPAFV